MGRLTASVHGRDLIFTPNPNKMEMPIAKKLKVTLFIKVFDSEGSHVLRPTMFCQKLNEFSVIQSFSGIELLGNSELDISTEVCVLVGLSSFERNGKTQDGERKGKKPAPWAPQRALQIPSWGTQRGQRLHCPSS